MNKKRITIIVLALIIAIILALFFMLNYDIIMAKIIYILLFERIGYVMSCLVCERIKMIKENTNPYFVAELETGFVVIGDHQRFKGYTLFLCKNHVSELHHLEPSFKTKFLNEMSLVAEAVQKTFGAEKMNYELLGNGDAHAHWHLFPRHSGDMPITGPVWWTPKAEMYDDKFRPNREELQEMVQNLKTEIFRLQAKSV